MTSPGGRIEIRVDPDLRGFSTKLGSGLESSARSGVARFASVAKKALIGAAVGIGAAAVLAGKSTLQLGIDYTNQLNTLQAVSGATAAQMRAVGKTAVALGNDLSLPATSAADAAAVMTELAKAGFSVADAQTAAKGSLQLAAAAQIDGARAAEIQANAIQAFSLKASDAGHVADVLANSANASSAEITDMADALAQAGSVAAASHIPIEDTAAALGILANNGIKGSDAGTLLKSALLAMRDAGKPAQAAMHELGLTVYDAQGRFVGLESVFGQLAVAQHKMSQQAFEAATNTLFGSDASRLAGVAAKTGAAGFDTMRVAMSKQGAAADVARAKSKGLGGALQAFQSQVETFQIDLYSRAAPDIEKLVRYAAAEFPKVGDSVISGLNRAVGFFHDLGVEARKDLQAVADYLAPVTSEVDDLWRSLTAANGPAATFWHLLQTGGHVLVDVAKAAHPLVEAGGELLHLFSSLPGPLQTVILALAALKVATSLDLFGRMAASEGALVSATGRAGNSITGLGKNLVGFGQTVRVNMRLAGDEVGGLEKVTGGLSAGFQTYLPRASSAVKSFSATVKTAFAEAKRDARFDVAEQFGQSVRTLPKYVGDAKGALAGLTAGAKNLATTGFGAVSRAGSSLVGFLGGPWGVALIGAGLLVGQFESDLQDVKAAEDAAGAAGETLGQTYQRLGNIFGQSAMAARQAAVQASGLGDTFKDAGVDAGTLTLALQGNRQAQDEVLKSAGNVDAKNLFKHGIGAGFDFMTGESHKARSAVQEFFDKLNGSTSNFDLFNRYVSDAGSALESFQTDAQRVFGDAALGVNADALSTAMGDLASNTGDAAKQADALRRILDILSGNAVSAQQVTADTTQAISAMGDAFTSVQAGAVTSAGAIDLNSKAGADLYGRLQDLSSQYRDVVTETYQSVEATNGQAAAADAAGKKATTLYNGFILSATGAGISRAEADKLAKSLGLVPGDVVTQFLQPGMTDSQVAAQILRQKVIDIPDSKTVHTQALTAQAQQALEAVGLKVETLPDGTVKVTADTGPARAAISSLIYDFSGAAVNLGVSVRTGRQAAATGGYITGPGTGTSDSIPAWLSNGEYVHRARAVVALGVDTEHALNRMDWRAALPRIQQLAAQQSRSVLAAAAAGRQAGRYAAGGFVTAENRASAAAQGTALVPQRVANVTNNLYAAPGLPTLDQLARMQRESEILAGV